MMTNTAWTTSWNSYMHYLNIQAGGRDASRSNPKVVAMDRFTAHQLRHTYATMLYDAGVDVKTAQDFLGHADPTVTMNIYTHLSSQKKGEGDPCFAAAFFGHDPGCAVKDFSKTCSNSRQKLLCRLLFLLREGDGEIGSVVNLLSKCCQTPK